MGINFTWLGHSAFSLNINSHPILIDPFLQDNPLAPVKPDDVEAEIIFLSHAHGDHLGDTVAIAQRTGAKVVCNFEMTNWLQKNGVENVQPQQPGGGVDYDFVHAKWTVAHHSSSFPDGTYGGQPNGFILTVDDKKIYFAGDTSLFSDMQLIGNEGIDVAFLPIGDLFTMGIDDSLRAIEFIKPKFVVPMHYNTWPPIVQDVASWAQRVNSNTSAQPIVLDPGGTHTIA
ncbi:MAG: metal-dependent hydrolase [Phototrophicales bacterium]|nr:MAG: metal-dependent hydrolase [Phototrophicales bacterium]